jgi:hypothetical protein
LYFVRSLGIRTVASAHVGYPFLKKTPTAPPAAAHLKIIGQLSKQQAHLTIDGRQA